MDSVERVLLSITKVSTLQKIRNSNLRFHSKFICSGFRKSPGPACGSSNTHTLIVRCNQMHPETEINQETIKSKWRTEQIAAKLHSKWKNTRVLVWRWMQPERWLTTKPLVWQETALYESDRGIKFKKTNSLNATATHLPNWIPTTGTRSAEYFEWISLRNVCSDSIY